ncbi:hypothetical protein N7495_007092 [Penicillium taxi]|uniref:uncharacterized protein n=1 Tax=Penicillium taxi TaxID=168475 RepID=UPI0025453574|nr:uncharacterized protein N7495_007092 [Penicillium taxi]KAJ5895401.1 hypothetical protein N7495_007092 [Penicillium taxi]
MTKLQFTVLDVFTSKPYSGNPLAVVFLPEDESKALTQHQKQTIAKEFNLSETIFVHPNREQSKRTIDIFTTDAELPFAGHPTIGAVTWLLCLAPDAQSTEINTLVTKSGGIAISLIDSETKFVSAKIAHNTHIHAAQFSLQDLLRLQPALAGFFPQQSVSFPQFSCVKGMNQILVELPSLEALAAVTLSAGSIGVDALDEGWRLGHVCLYFFVRDVDDEITKKKIIRTRAIENTMEDPATGSAASGLTSYLTLIEGQAGKQHRYSLVQGVEMGRRSEIGVNVTLNADKKIEQVELTGTAVQVSEGKISVPEL